jgi:hypothetical protein
MGEGKRVQRNHGMLYKEDKIRDEAKSSLRPLSPCKEKRLKGFPAFDDSKDAFPPPSKRFPRRQAMFEGGTLNYLAWFEAS